MTQYLREWCGSSIVSAVIQLPFHTATPWVIAKDVIVNLNS